MLRGAWETFARDEIAIISVEPGDVAVVRVVGVEPCFCFGIRGEVAAVLRISRIPWYRRLRRRGGGRRGDDGSGVFREFIVASVGGHEPGASDTVHRQISEHGLTADRLRNVHTQRFTRGH